MDNAALRLDAFRVGVVAGAPQLLLGEPPGEQEKHHDEDEVAEKDPGIPAVASLDGQSRNVPWQRLQHGGAGQRRRPARRARAASTKSMNRDCRAKNHGVATAIST